ncbi:MAG: three-Cys-motif partner protein TcmP [Chloroflexi bacterium]|nr:three-Cys-motif partner protein TcmP [Chloroflexota bacterium]
MPDTSQQFFQEIKDWSDRKLTLVQKYLVGFVRILGSLRSGDVFYIDGFAGRGIYQDGSKGSPIRAAKYAFGLKIANKSYGLRCINVEANRENYSNLVQSTSPFAEVVTNYSGTFIENIDPILSLIGNSAAIFFLDDFGVSGYDWASVERLINREAPTDIWIRFDTATIRRLDGFFESAKPGSEKKYAKLPKLYGIDDSSLLHSRLSGRSSNERVNNALQLYLERLATQYRNGRGGFAGAYPIRSIKGQRKFFLVSATGHPKGIILASDVIYGVEEDYQSQIAEYRHQVTRQPTLFSMDPSKEEIFQSKVNAIKEEILTEFKGRTVSRTAIRLFLMRNWFGRIKGSHVTKALNQLHSDGRILNKVGTFSKDDSEFTFGN